MPIVCIDRPNRTKRRTFTAKDVGRICRMAQKAGEPSSLIITELKECLGEDIGDVQKIRQKLKNLLKDLDTVADIVGLLAALFGKRGLKLLRTVGTLALRLGRQLFKKLPDNLKQFFDDAAEFIRKLSTDLDKTKKKLEKLIDDI